MRTICYIDGTHHMDDIDVIQLMSDLTEEIRLLISESAWSWDNESFESAAIYRQAAISLATIQAHYALEHFGLREESKFNPK